MKIKDIDLKHFNIVLKKKRAGFTPGTISIKSKSYFAHNYKDSHDTEIRLKYEFDTDLVFKDVDINQKIKVADLTEKQQSSIKQSIVAKINKTIQLRNKILYRPAIKKATNNVEINDEVVDTDDFDFTELDQDQTEPKIVKKPDISDDFDFDFDDVDTVKEITPKLTNDLNLQDDFNFEDDVLSKEFNNEETLVNAKHLNDEFDFNESDVKPETTLETISKDFDFDFDDDDDVLDTSAPTKTIKNIVTTAKLKGDTTNEAASGIVKKLPYFHLFSGGYRLTIHFNSKTFSASGDNQNIVNSLHHLATLIFINYDFLTSEKHPEWLYSALQDDVKVIFENTISLNHDTFVEMDAAIKVIEAGIYSALFNYRNILEYFKHHKPLAIEHE